MALHTKIIRELIRRNDPLLACQWASASLLAEREDFPDERPSAALLALLNHFTDDIVWHSLMADDEWVCNDFSLESLDAYREIFPATGIQGLALACVQHGKDELLGLLVHEVPCSYWAIGERHFRWIDQTAGIKLSEQQVIDRIAKNTMASGDNDEVLAGLIWLGENSQWIEGEDFPLNLEHYSDIAIKVLRRYADYLFSDAFVIFLVNTHLSGFDSCYHAQQLVLLEESGIPLSLLMLSNHHRRSRLMHDLDI
jgi:hypothetical protein